MSRALVVQVTNLIASGFGIVLMCLAVYWTCCGLTMLVKLGLRKLRAKVPLDKNDDLGYDD